MDARILVSSLRRGFTLRSARDYVPQIDKLVPYNTKEFILQKKVFRIHPETRRKQQEVS